MQNTLTDLNNYLFEALERLYDDDLSDEELDRELKRADSIVKVSEKIIENGELAFKTIKHMDEYGYNRSRDLPPVLAIGGATTGGDRDGSV